MATPLEFVIQGDDRSAQAFSSLGKNLKKTNKVSKDLLGKFAKLTIVAQGASAAFRLMKRATGGMFTAAQKQITVEIQLASALAKNGEEVRKNLERLKEFASARQAVTTFGDETTLELARVGATFGMTTDQIEKAVVAVQDTAVQMGKAPLRMMRIFGQAVSGVSDDWAGLGISIDKALPKQEKFDQAIRKMTSGVSEAIGALPISQLDKLGNSFGDLLEKIGQVIVSTGTFRAVVDLVGRAVSWLNKALADPKVMKQVADFIDSMIVGWVKWSLEVPKIILKGMGHVVRGLEVIASTMAVIATKVVSVLIKGFGKVVEAISVLVGFMDGKAEKSMQRFAVDMKALGDEMETFTVDISGGSEAIFMLADGLEKAQGWVSTFVQASKPIASVYDQIVESLERASEANRAMAQGPTDEQLQQAEAFLEQVSATLEDAGSDLAAVFSTAVQDAFDKDVGYKEAFKNLGDDVRTTFTGQFSDAAFAPLKQQFGQLAIALAQPFEIVGQITASLFKPLTSLVSKVISTIVTELLTVIGLQELAAVTGLAGVATVSAAASGLGAAWGAAATAAAIATLGGALAAAPAAQAAIVAGAAQTRALSIPLAEGGLVQPRPGGVPATIAEGGEAELVTPLSKLPDILRQAGIGGGGGGINVTLEAGQVVLSGEDAEDNLAALGEAFSDELRRAQDFAHFQRNVVTF